MKVSVVMTAYNGSKYIIKQMESIRTQTYKPEEVIIADDRSSDNTFDVVVNYIKNNHLENWIAYQNERNYGFIMNYFHAMKKATGDYVFFSDQDDVWELSKIKEMIEIISKCEDMLILMSKENRIDENDEYIQFADEETRKVRKISLIKEIRTCLGAGHLLVARRSFLDRYMNEMVNNGMTFDVPFCIFAAAQGGLYQYDRRLVKRRIHKNNTSGIKNSRFDRIKDYDRYVKGRFVRNGYFQCLLKNWEQVANSENKADYEELRQAVKLLDDSANALKRHKMMPLLREAVSRNKYLNKSISAANILALARTTLLRK